MIINHNLGAMNALSALNANSNALQSSLEKLSSGKKINSAADDASGYAISQKMQSQINGLNQASQNAQDGISMIQTASGALNETTSLLQNMRQLSVQASNSTTTTADRQDLQQQFNQLASQINNIGNTTQFNTQDLLNGGISSSNSSVITQAKGASITLGAITPGPTAAGTSISVDGQTFNLGGITTTGADAATISQLNNVTSGSTKLSDVVNITANGGKLEFTDKSTGSSSTISFSAAADAAIGLGAATTAVTGSPTTMQMAGIQFSGTPTSGSLTSADNFQISFGGGSATTVSFSGTTTINSAQDAANALNASFQQSGLSGQVTAAVDQNGKVQLISQSGKDISLSGTSANFATVTGYTSGTDKAGNVKEVVGPGAVGSGFSASFQIGANTGQTMNLTIGDMRAAALGVTGNAGQQGFSTSNNVTDGTDNVNSEAALDITSTTNADNAINTIDNAIQTVTTEQANLGAVQNRLQSTINNLGTSSQNLTTAQSGITDVDMASEMANFTQQNVLQQAAVSMLAQANQQPQLVLKLLG